MSWVTAAITCWCPGSTQHNQIARYPSRLLALTYDAIRSKINPPRTPGSLASELCTCAQQTFEKAVLTPLRIQVDI